MPDEAFLRRVEMTGLRIEPDELAELAQYIESVDQAAELIRKARKAREEPAYAFTLAPRAVDRPPGDDQNA